MHSSRLKAALLMFLACACENVSGDPAGDIVRTDSAGIQIIDVPASAFRDLPDATIDSQPLLRIGVADGASELQLYGARNVSTLSDGRIAVLNAGTQSVRFFRADGTFDREVGRSGEGPGEFQEPSGLAVVRGDSVVVWDRALGRATVIAPDGSVGRIHNVHALRLNESWIGALDDGSVYVHWRYLTSGETNRNRNILVHVAGDKVDTISSIMPDMKNVTAFGRKRWELEEFAPQPLHASARNQLWSTDNGPLALFRRSPDGDTLALLRLAVQRRPVTPDFLEWYSDSIAFKGPWPPEEKDEVRRIMDRRGAADSMPSLDRLVVGQDGRLWMRRYKFPGESGDWQWLVVEADGRPVWNVSLPRTFSPFEFGQDYILGVSRDSLDVQYIEKYAIVQRPRGP